MASDVLHRNYFLTPLSFWLFESHVDRLVTLTMHKINASFWHKKLPFSLMELGSIILVW